MVDQRNPQSQLRNWTGRDVEENLIPAYRPQYRPLDKIFGDIPAGSTDSIPPRLRRCEKIDFHGGRAGILRKF